MAEVSYNLVTITGSKNEIEKFEKTAYKNECEAFNLENFIGYEGESSLPNLAVFNTNWISFGIQIEKTNDSLKYFCNSKWSAVDLKHLVQKFPELNFKQVYVEIATEKVGVIDYSSKEQHELIGNFEMWDNLCSPHTYTFIEDVGIKLDWLISQNISDLDGKHFFDIVEEPKFLNRFHELYENLFHNAIELEKQNLFKARHGMFYNLHSHQKENLEFFVCDYILPDKQTEFFEKLSYINFNVSKGRRWWNCIDNHWKEFFIDSLINFNSTFNEEDRDILTKHIFESIQVSDQYLMEILELENIIIPFPLVFDNAETVLDFLPNLKTIYFDLEDYDGGIEVDDKLSYCTKEIE
ncbi:hypothetical protein [Maribellus mangrovi]|uniref:hypothetical protein n=1 Tax=Maribellus mangrovi TaxID=3133146 RepID=UPI0030EB4CCA